MSIHGTVKMADDAAARREARRRRILENSHNRLQLISGKSAENCQTESTTRFPVPDLNTDLYSPPEISSSCLFSPSSSVLNNGVVVTEPLAREPPARELEAAGDNGLANDLAGLLSSPPQPTQPQTFWEQVISYKYDVVLVSLITQLLYSLSLVSFDNAYFFLSLIVYSVTKLIWFPRNTKSNIANVFLLMNGISANKASGIMSATQLIGGISQDICVYLFVTICVQSLLQLAKDMLIT